MSRNLTSSGLVVLVLFLLLSTSFLTSSSIVKKTETSQDNGWYYLPAYPNYAPQGLPDFDQKQDNWKAHKGIYRLIGGLWNFCAPSSLADIFWWFDSKHENSSGSPGDGVDSYPLVRDLKAPGIPTPGPNTDDHNFNNVNDLETRWRLGRGGKELIESLAWYCNTNFCQYPLLRLSAGTWATHLEKGANQWIKDAGLEGRYRVEAIWKPDFPLIASRIMNNSGVMLNLLLYNDKAIFFDTFLGHYVAVAGINPNGSIALSDPFQNEANPTPTAQEHNNANVVSYDIYPVNLTSPFPDTASWWIPEYFDFGIKRFGGIPQFALIVSEIE